MLNQFVRGIQTHFIHLAFAGMLLDVRLIPTCRDVMFVNLYLEALAPRINPYITVYSADSTDDRLRFPRWSSTAIHCICVSDIRLLTKPPQYDRVVLVELHHPSFSLSLFSSHTHHARKRG